MINFNNNTLDDKTIESIKYIVEVSASSISQIVEAFERLCVALSESLEVLSESLEVIESTFKELEEMIADMPDDDIPALKKQIKYCKNPMEIKALNKRLNDAYKRKNKKR